MTGEFQTTLTRLDNNLWRYLLPDTALEEIQIQTPVTTEPAVGYKLACVVQKALQKLHIGSLDQLKHGFYVNIRQEDSPVVGKWKVSLVRSNSIWNRILQFFPFMATYPNLRIARVQVSPTTSLCSKIADIFSAVRREIFCMEKRVKVPYSEIPFDRPNEPFSDAFTLLATTYLQTVDPYFVSEEKLLAAFRFVLQPNGSLTLRKLSTQTTPIQEIEENRRTAVAFRDYYVQQFGKEKIDYVNAAYGFNVDEMIDQGQPLTPDHVFKTNIGMCNVELTDVQRLLDRLIANQSDELPISQQSRLGELNSVRSLLPTATVSVQTLPPALFNALVNVVMPSPAERERAYTGRKIHHLAIGGWNTMGNPNIFNPSRDLFELMQVYDQVQKTNDWDEYFELLTHVAAKKNLFRKNAASQNLQPDQQGWHVGILLPGPRSKTGQEHWYCNTSMVDDAHGNVNYGLEPACHGYQLDDAMLPFIKDYRSTASSRNAIDWMESIAADLNPYGAPESLDPHDSFRYEKSYYDRRTVPLWVAHLLHAQKSSARSFQAAIDEYVMCLRSPGRTPPVKLVKAIELQASGDNQAIEAFLLSEGELHRELPVHKVAQDIASIGHSLGASLAQFGIYYFGPRRRRIPLPDHNFICYSSRGPAIDRYQDALFMKFGRTYAQLLVALGQRWKIREQLEYGDFVPEVGHCHLGTTNYDPALDAVWLDQKITLFRPLKTAQSLEITTLHTHERRTSGTALLGRDYIQNPLSIRQLSNFDHAWWMSKKLIRMFGFRVLRSSKVTEFGREVAAIASYPFWLVAIKVYNWIWPPIGKRDKDGVLFLRYSN